MKYVVKLGGAGLESPSILDGCVRAIVELSGAHFDPRVVAAFERVAEQFHVASASLTSSDRTE